MHAQNQRAARAALDTARGTMARLDSARDPEDAAADIVEGWRATETALRELLGGSSQEGQTLIREARSRELLSLEQTHALLQFLAAYERVRGAGYRVTSADIAAARVGFREIEAAASETPPQQVMLPTPRGSGPTPVPPPPPARRWSTRTIAGLAIAAGAILGVGAWLLFGGRGPEAAMRPGVEAYREGRREAALGEFQRVAQEYPESPLPHVYIARLQRESGDLPGAQRSLQKAMELDPGHQPAQREMGALLFASGQYELARRFYVRAVELDPEDRSAQGYLGCTMAMLGQSDAATRFLNRAGAGPWSSCANRILPQAPAAVAPPQ